MKARRGGSREKEDEEEGKVVIEAHILKESISLSLMGEKEQ